jgi:serine/threonine protein kinase
MGRATVLMGGESPAVPLLAGGEGDGRRRGGGDRAERGETIFQPEDRFADFVIRRFLGRGGAAEVYEALLRGKRCAIKVTPTEFQVDEAQIRRANKEAQILIQIRHPNVIDVQDVGIHDGIFWMRMEMLDGLDLREAMHRIGPMSVALAGGWLHQAAYGAHQCHMLGIIHRDIKPENIFLIPPHSVKLLDFGIAKRLGDMSTFEEAGRRGERPAPVGTAPYMSPEQVQDGVMTPASDVYALGMTFWEMVMGYHPFLPKGVTYEFWPMLQKQIHREVPPLSTLRYPGYVSRVIERAVSKRWQERQPNGLAFAQELERACRRYAEEHPDEDTSPGEPALAWLLGEAEAPPSFGTGPEKAPRSAWVRREAGATREPEPAPRFGTEPLTALAEVLDLAEPMDRDTDPMPAPPEAMDRDTDPMAVPLEIRRFDTVSLPPPLRDPTAIQALAGVRPSRRAGVPASVALGVPARPRFGAPPWAPPGTQGEARSRSLAEPRGGARRLGPRMRDFALLALFSIGWAVALGLLYVRFTEVDRAAPSASSPVLPSASAMVPAVAPPEVASGSAPPVAPPEVPRSAAAPPGPPGSSPRPIHAGKPARPPTQAGAEPRRYREPIFTRTPEPVKARPTTPPPRRVEDIF